jgi:cytochrome P450
MVPTNAGTAIRRPRPRYHDPGDAASEALAGAVAPQQRLGFQPVTDFDTYTRLQLQVRRDDAASAPTEVSVTYGRGMQTTERLLVTGDIRAALCDPRLDVTPVPTGSAPGTLGWLRERVPRFASSAIHADRRSLTESLIAELDLPQLRHDTANRARDALGDGPFDVMATLARHVPLAALATALGASTMDPADAVTVAQAYLPPAQAGEADAAVARLVDAFGGTPDDRTAHRIGLLGQAGEATAGLIGTATVLMLRARRGPDDAVAAALRTAPPARANRRVALLPTRIAGVDIAAGEIVRLDLEGEVWGLGPHACPGGAVAVALAVGVLEAVRGMRLLDDAISYPPVPAPQVPSNVWVGP